MFLTVPVPKDINLPLPMPKEVLIIILIVSFLLHIFFVNLMIGGTILTLWYEIRGIWKEKYDRLANLIASSITVNKSLAVVLGVAPLLTINVLYTIYFYSANALTGLMWIAVIPWASIIFLLLYLHKYTWDKLHKNKPLHISLLIIPVVSFLFIPFIFITNINLMLFPEKWGEINGFASALIQPSVLTRYIHFMLASMAITGLFLVWYTSKKRVKYLKENKLEITEVARNAYNICFWATLSQIIAGPLLLLTIPVKGIKWNMILTLSAGILLAIVLLILLWKEVKSENPGRLLYPSFTILFCILVFMGTGRHLYRANALEYHQQMVENKTNEFQKLVNESKIDTLSSAKATEDIISGKMVFENNCKVCHSVDKRLVGPPLTEVRNIYKGQTEAFKDWVVNPGRKRPDYPPMTGFPNLSESKLDAVANYILNEMSPNSN